MTRFHREITVKFLDPLRLDSQILQMQLEHSILSPSNNGLVIPPSKLSDLAAVSRGTMKDFSPEKPKNFYERCRRGWCFFLELRGLGQVHVFSRKRGGFTNNFDAISCAIILKFELDLTQNPFFLMVIYGQLECLRRLDSLADFFFLAVAHKELATISRLGRPMEHWQKGHIYGAMQPIGTNL